MKHILELIIFAGLLNLIVILLNLSKKSNFTVDLDYNKNEFNVNNLCCYFSSVKGEVSMKRKIHLINELNKYNIKYQVDSGVTNLDTNNARMYQHILNKLLAFKKSNYDEILILDSDLTFNSPSAAASVIKNRATNGRKEWILKDGTTLDDYENK
jgi:hypothetical protein